MAINMSLDLEEQVEIVGGVDDLEGLIYLGCSDYGQTIGE